MYWSRLRVGARTGQTVLFFTHYLEEADEHADRLSSSVPEPM
jgi:ABC-2 type transport system ATP-binding protein